MARSDVSKRESGKNKRLKGKPRGAKIYDEELGAFIREGVEISWALPSSRTVLRELARSLSDERRVADRGLWTVRAYLREIEDRLAQLEAATFSNRMHFGKPEDRVGIASGIGLEVEQDWPAFASEEFAKLDENRKGLEEYCDDKELVLYHIMEIETFLGKVERKARTIGREYEARLAGSLRDICKIHEPSELSASQIERFAASLQALVEGWGKLNRDKVKWIRARLLEVGLTWLPVTQKAQAAIDEVRDLKSSVT